MRLSMILGFVLAILLIWPASQQVQEEMGVIPPLNPSSVSYCELSACGYLKELGLEIVSPARLAEGEYGTEVFIRVINRGRLSGEREFWAELRDPAGNFVEAMRGVAVLSSKGPQQVRFFFTGSQEELENLVLEFGY